MTKKKATLIHFFISLLVVFSFLIFAYLIWYDRIYVAISGVMEPVKILIIVHIILGPFFTFIIFKEGKKHLKLDLSVIVLVQVLAFGFGVYTLYLGKPSMVVLKQNSFEIIVQQSLNYEVLSQELKREFNSFGKPFYGYISTQDINNFKSAEAQQQHIKPLVFGESVHLEREAPMDQVFQLLAVEKDALAAQLGRTDLKGLTFYLMNDLDWYAVVIFAENHQPYKIIQSDKLAQAQP